MKRSITIALSLCLFAFAGMAQPTTTTTPAAPTLPAYVSVVGEFNQLASPRMALGASAIYTTQAQNGIGMVNITSADIVPIKATDPATGKTFYAVNAQVRQGVGEKIFATGSFRLYLGADLGPGFSSTPNGGISVSATGSFVAVPSYKLNDWLSITAPARMLYVPSVGWNPVFQAGVTFNLHKLPAAK